MTPEQKIGVLFKASELKMVIGLLESKEEECFTSDKKAEAEVYNTLAVQLESIYAKALENPKKDLNPPHQVGWVSPQDPGDENDQPAPKDEYIQSVEPQAKPIALSHTNVVIQMEGDYMETMDSFRNILDEQYLLFAKKQADYGPGNISMNGNKNLALVGLGVRMNDKTQRILHLTHNNKEPNNESLEDSFKDISIYGIIAQIVLKDKWGK